MRYFAVIVSAALVFLLVAPAAFAQPFADVPTNHWAYDAIAELAAKGIVEGYPDGTFKGDRAMTRYEMAMVVARLLARIESIQVPAPAMQAPAPAPAPAAPPITRVDVETIQRLVNEFRAELAALGVRTTAIEEELNAIKAKVGNVKFGGLLRFRGEEQRTGAGKTVAVNGNGNVLGTDASSQPTYPRNRDQFSLFFDGSVSPDVHLIGDLLTGPSTAGQNYTIFNSSNGSEILALVDSLFFDWKNAFSLPLEFWLGRWGCDLSPCYSTQFGPFGLLLNTAGHTWEDATFVAGNATGNNFADGLVAKYSMPALLDLRLQAAVLQVAGGSFGTGSETAYGVDANVKVLTGLRVGVDYVANNIVSFPNTITYGPGGGSVNAPGSNCTGTAGPPPGFTCDLAGNGWGVYAQYDVTQGIHLDGEYAQWNDGGPAHPGTSDTGYQVNVHWDLGTLTGVGHNFSLDTGYLNFGSNFYPPYGGAEPDIAMADNIYPGNENGFLARTNYDLNPSWSLYAIYYGGNTTSSSQPMTEYEAGVVFKFAPSAKITFKIRDLKVNNIEQFFLYRAQMDYAF